MDIYSGIKIIDLALYIKTYKTLIISDLQIGYEESLIRQGIFIPKIQKELIKERLNKIFSKVRPDRVIINGDFKHEFGSINRQEWKDTLEILDLIFANCKEIILIRGNHDIVLGPIARRRNIDLVDFYKMGKISILHGHKVIPSLLDSKLIIIGHEHPAVSLREGSKIERFKCFLKGKYGRNDLIVIPSFNVLNEGSDISKGRVLSPFLKQNLDKFEVYVVEDNVYKFGKLSKIK